MKGGESEIKTGFCQDLGGSATNSSAGPFNCAPPAKSWGCRHFPRDQPFLGRGGAGSSERLPGTRVLGAGPSRLRPSCAAAAGDFACQSLPRATVTFAEPCASGPAPPAGPAPRAQRHRPARPSVRAAPPLPSPAGGFPSRAPKGQCRRGGGGGTQLGEGSAASAHRPAGRSRCPAAAALWAPHPGRTSAPHLAAPPPREPLPARRHPPIVRTHRPPRAPAPGSPGPGSPGRQPTARPGSGRGPRGARGPAGRPSLPQAGPGDPRPRWRPAPDARGAAARSARPAHLRYLPSGRASRRLAGAPPRSEGSERLPSAGQPWPAPYVKRRRLRRHSAEGGRRRTAAAPLRYPATGLSAQPTGRAPYPSAQEPGLHQRHRPAPAPPLRPALGFPTRAGERRALELGGALLLQVGAGSRREVGGQEAGAYPVCGA